MMLHGERGLHDSYHSNPMFTVDKSKEAEHIVTKIAQAKGSLILDSPFFGYLLSYMPIIPVNEEIQNFATDAKYLYFNTTTILDILNHNENWRGKIKGMLIHLLIHMIFRHYQRQLDRNPKIWAYAADIVVYSYMLEFRNEQHVPSDWELIHFRNVPEELLGYSTEETYDLLISYFLDNIDLQEEINEKGRGADVGEPRDEKLFENMGEKVISDLEEEVGLTGNQCELETVVQENNSTDLSGSSSFEDDYLEGIIQLAYEKSKHGFIPNSLRRALSNLFTPTINWKTQLAHYLQSSLIKDFTWSRPNQRLFGQGYYLPGTIKENAELLVGIDTSGSISQDDLTWFLVELQSIIGSISNAKLTVVDCDAKVQQITSYELGEPIHHHQPQGGGGTDFRPVFALYSKYTPEVIIYFTDGLGIYPENPPGCPVIWVLAPSDDHNTRNPPFGKTIHMETNALR